HDQALHAVLRMQTNGGVVSVDLHQAGLHPAAGFAHLAAEHLVTVPSDERLGAHAEEALGGRIDACNDLTGVVQDQCVGELVEDITQYLGVLPAGAELGHIPRKTHCMTDCNCWGGGGGSRNGSIRAIAEAENGQKVTVKQERGCESAKFLIDT